MIGMTAGQKLQALRKSNNLSVDNVCDSLYISKSSLNKYETNRRVPRDDVKKRIAEFYGVSVESIFFEN